MLDILIRGGPIMIPLFACSILAVAVSLERLWYLFRTRVDDEDLMDEIRLALSQGKVLEAVQVAKRSPGQIASVLAAGIAHYDRSKEEIRERLEEAGREELFKMERHLALLDTIVTIAPLLGLLGTVTGIIRSFRVLAALEGLESPSALSIGIAEALITTAAGLVIAIPTMAIHNWVVSIIDRRVNEMNRRAGELLEILAAREGT